MGLGELAALSTAFLWALSFQIHTYLSRFLGVGGIVLIRLPISIVLLFSMILITGTSLTLPSNLAIIKLILSAVLGIVVCDLAIFASAVRIGARLAVLVQSSSASFSAVLGYLFLDQGLPFINILGIFIAFLGVAIALTGSGLAQSLPVSSGELQSKQLLKGVVFGLLSAFGLAAGFLFSKEAINEGVSPMYTGLLRVFIAMLSLLLLNIFKKPNTQIVAAIKKSPKILLWLALGGACGTTGIWLSMVSIDLTSMANASLLMGLVPIIIIPMAAFLEKKKPRARSLLGSGIAVLGSAIVVLN